MPSMRKSKYMAWIMMTALKKLRRYIAFVFFLSINLIFCLSHFTCVQDASECIEQGFAI